jgi:hypothetical protein
MSTDRELIWPLGTSGAALGARRIRDAVGLQDWVWLWNCGQGVKRWGWSKVCCILASASAAVLQRVTIHVHPFGPYGFGTGIATIWALRKIEGMLPSTFDILAANFSSACCASEPSSKHCELGATVCFAQIDGCRSSLTPLQNRRGLCAAGCP